jgi:TonB-dependent SusC/RagA subfamily outer membrane receptor
MARRAPSYGGGFGRQAPMTYRFARSVVAGFALVRLAAGCASSQSARAGAPGAAPSVTSKDIEQNPGVPVEKILEAKAPGLSARRTTDGGIVLEIRGSSSFMSGSAPLYIVDGNPMQPSATGALPGLNPYDIDTIKVLKNPEDTGIYGVRGGNGVIVITTKRPGRR